jgi:hypothetical protein
VFAAGGRLDVDDNVPAYGAQPELLDGPVRPRRRRLRGPLGWLTLLVILAVLAAAAYALLSPFALHIGGRSTLDRTWHGVGAVTATNGGRYAVYVSFRADVEHSDSPGSPYHCSQPGCDAIHGEGKLCTLSGTTYPLEVEGEVYAWWSTDGALTHVRLSVPNSNGSTIVALFEGRWRGQDLPLTDSTEFTVALTREGEIRAARSTVDDGVARTTLRYGGEGDFAAACHALTAR